MVLLFEFKILKIMNLRCSINGNSIFWVVFIVIFARFAFVNSVFFNADFVSLLMKIAFVSECLAFYNILSKELSSKYPALVFEHFEDSDHFLQSEGYGFQKIIFKVSGQMQSRRVLLQIRKRFPLLTIIGLALGKDFHSQKGMERDFDFLFRDSEVEEKLSAYFSGIFPAAENPSSVSEMQEIKKKYIALDSIKSRCLLLIYQGKKASEIALQLNKSVRTVEKYIVFLRRHFHVKRKQDLIEICHRIIA
jgi:DNA-binding NarL/FixJ family response regulator